MAALAVRMSRSLLKLAKPARPVEEVMLHRGAVQVALTVCLAQWAASALFKMGSWRQVFRRRNSLAASSIAASVQRRAMNASRQCFRLRQTRQTVPFLFSMMFAFIV